jgi:amino acid adenylation domain-containing protein
MHNESLPEVLSQTARAFKGRTAIEWQNQRVSYAELETRTNELANYLLSVGVTKGDVIALVLDDRISLIETVIGILKAGCAFAPLNLNNPETRLRSMLQVIKPSLFIIEEKFYGKLSGLLAGQGLPARFVLRDAQKGDEGESVSIEGVRHYAGYDDAELPSISTAPDDMCYIYFTSGSTGIPKAIAGRIKSLLHFVRWEIKTLGINHEHRISQLVTPTFDAFLRDIFVPLCAGATICIPDHSEVLLDPARLVEWLDENRINLVHCVPSIFRALVRHGLEPQRLSSLRHIVMAGERLSPSEVKRWIDVYGERIQLVNLYGATENTMAKFCHFIDQSDTYRNSIPIGQPIEGAKAIILDADNNMCDQGVAGEIYIRTPFLSLGYYRDPEATAKAFVQNPFNANPRDLIHKTGDFGRLLPDGNYELIGRKDHQVKIRGQRVELGEIESVLKERASVEECVVMLWGEDPEDQRLVAYVVILGSELDANHLQTVAREFLPDYMIPSAFVRLESLPLLTNGKIDRNSLPAPDELRLLPAESYLAPANDIEQKLADIWAEILHVERVGRHDNFFQLGGHSLLATQVMSRVREEFQTEVPLRELFEQPNIAKLSTLIEQMRAEQQENDEAQIFAMVEALSEEQLTTLLEPLAGEGPVNNPETMSIKALR